MPGVPDPFIRRQEHWEDVSSLLCSISRAERDIGLSIFLRYLSLSFGSGDQLVPQIDISGYVD